MKQKRYLTFSAATLALTCACLLAGCAGTTPQATSSSTSAEQTSSQETATPTQANANTQQQAAPTGGGMNGMDTQPGQTTDKGYTATNQGIDITTTLNADEAFTDRDLQQEVDTTSAQKLSLSDGQNLTISSEGVYVVSGSAQDASIVVEASETDKVQIVLDGVTITNQSTPAIYVKSADKTFVTLHGTNELSVTGEMTADGDTNTDAVIFAKDDICLNGTGQLTITSTANGISCKDDLKVTGGTYAITCEGDALEANDSIRIAAGTFTINAQNNAIQAKNDDDNELGYVYIKDGTFDITAADNGIQGYAFVRIDGGTINITGEECIEGTYIQINGGTIKISANDDAINASIKSSVYTPTLEITGGDISIEMASGDTDALDSNGYLYIKGGTLNISAQSAFDYSWGAEMTGGTVYVNGEQLTEITESMMGPGFGGGGAGQMPPDDGNGRPTPPDGSGNGSGQPPQQGTTA